MPEFNANRSYTVNEDVAEELEQLTAGRGVPMVISLRGYVDAGHAGDHLVEHLRSGGETLVTFDVDEFVDHRSRRPTIDFDGDRFTQFNPHELGIDLVRDSQGLPFLVMYGLEPDYRWNTFIDATAELIDRFGVDVTIFVHGIPMAMPHTRPLLVTYSASRDDLIRQRDLPVGVFGRVTIPGGVANVMLFRLGQLGYDTVSMAVHVPHYLAQSVYAPAVVLLAEKLAEFTGLELHHESLRQQAVEALDEVAIKVTESADMAALVRALEQQFDAFERGRSQNSLLAEGGELPSADDLAAELEQFLAEQHPDQP